MTLGVGSSQFCHMCIATQGCQVIKCTHNEIINKQDRRMTSQAPYRCVHNILITYDENKANADIPTHSLNNIYEA